MNGYLRVAVGVPEIKVADVYYNAEKIVEIIEKAKARQVEVLVFPELCMTASTCGDLFNQNALTDAVEKIFPTIMKASKGIDCVIVGAPIKVFGKLYNCAICIVGGKDIYVKHKTNLSLTERRCFSDFIEDELSCIRFANHDIQINDNLKIGFKFDDRNLDVFGDIVFGEAFKQMNDYGNAGLIFNLSATNETVLKKEQRINMISSESIKANAAYIYANAGYGESTTDFVYSGHSLICENGEILKQTKSFCMENQLIIQDLDIDKIICEKRMNDKLSKKTYTNNFNNEVCKITSKDKGMLERIIPQNPFIPENQLEKDELCAEILDIQKYGLIKRVEHMNCKKMIIGVSGGLDSTIALLVCVFAKIAQKEDLKDIIAITMPGYGTSTKTYNNAVRLIELLGVTFREIPISDACDLHFKDIGHDKRQDVAYENAQARERTQILMDIANMENGLVIGTGDFTELALGFATYNGDHMSNYCVNANLPKTIIKEVINWICRQEFFENEIKDILRDVIDTPISPELLPTTETGDIKQKTEEIVGSYELNDFFLYYVLKYGFSAKKIVYMAMHAFDRKYDEKEIENRLKLFYKRFIIHQFKRSCMPDGPAIYDFGFSPRGEYAMPSDASFNIWIKELEL